MPVFNPIAGLTLAAIGGTALYIAEPDLLETAQIGQPAPRAIAQDAAYSATGAAPLCGVAIDRSAEGRVIAAWAESAALPGGRGQYRLDLTRRTGGGGFDMVQEGDVPADPHAPGDIWLSEVWLNDGERVSGLLQVRDLSGALICEDRI